MTALAIIHDRDRTLTLTDPVFDADGRRAMWQAADELAAVFSRASRDVAYLTERVAAIEAVR